MDENRMIEQTYKLNMIPRAEQDFRSYEPPVVHISQYDKVLRTLRFELYDGEDPYLPDCFQRIRQCVLYRLFRWRMAQNNNFVMEERAWRKK